MMLVHLEVLGEVIFPREEVVVPLELCMLDPDNTVMVMCWVTVYIYAVTITDPPSWMIHG